MPQQMLVFIGEQGAWLHSQHRPMYITPPLNNLNIDTTNYKPGRQQTLCYYVKFLVFFPYIPLTLEAAQTHIATIQIFSNGIILRNVQIFPLLSRTKFLFLAQIVWLKSLCKAVICRWVIPLGIILSARSQQDFNNFKLQSFLITLYVISSFSPKW